MAKDYYKILDVNKTDSVDVIKKSYKKLAMKYHPDKAGDDKKKEFEEKFKEINEAYSTLSDESKRGQYDAGGQNNKFSQNSNFQGGDFSDLFGDIFGGGGFGGQSQEEELEKDLHFRLTIDFTEAAFGCEKEIAIKKNISCKSCNGTGSENDDFQTCSKCAGHGRIEVTQQTPFGVMRQVRGCDGCNGEGQIPKVKCKKCKGSGIVNKKEKIKIQIPKGIDNGQTLRITNAGNASKGGRKGDLFLEINIKPHKIFKRDGFDVYMDFSITFAEAALGAEVSIPTLTDKIKIKIAKGTESGSTLRLREKGIAYVNNPEYVGDQFVNLIVKTPKKLTRTQTKLFEELKKLDK
jgi:molecular chaperone DnaJ